MISRVIFLACLLVMGSAAISLGQPVISGGGMQPGLTTPIPLDFSIWGVSECPWEITLSGSERLLFSINGGDPVASNLQLELSETAPNGLWVDIDLHYKALWEPPDLYTTPVNFQSSGQGVLVVIQNGRRLYLYPINSQEFDVELKDGQSIVLQTDEWVDLPRQDVVDIYWNTVSILKGDEPTQVSTANQKSTADFFFATPALRGQIGRRVTAELVWEETTLKGPLSLFYSAGLVPMKFLLDGEEVEPERIGDGTAVFHLAAGRREKHSMVIEALTVPALDKELCLQADWQGKSATVKGTVLLGPLNVEQGQIVLTLVSEDGSPLSGEEVRLGGGRSMFTNSLGEVTLHLPPGLHSIFLPKWPLHPVWILSRSGARLRRTMFLPEIDAQKNLGFVSVYWDNGDTCADWEIHADTRFGELQSNRKTTSFRQVTKNTIWDFGLKNRMLNFQGDYEEGPREIRDGSWRWYKQASKWQGVVSFGDWSGRIRTNLREAPQATLHFRNALASFSTDFLSVSANTNLLGYKIKWAGIRLDSPGRIEVGENAKNGWRGVWEIGRSVRFLAKAHSEKGESQWEASISPNDWSLSGEYDGQISLRWTSKVSHEGGFENTVQIKKDFAIKNGLVSTSLTRVGNERNDLWILMTQGTLDINAKLQLFWDTIHTTGAGTHTDWAVGVVISPVRWLTAAVRYSPKRRWHTIFGISLPFSAGN